MVLWIQLRANNKNPKYHIARNWNPSFFILKKIRLTICVFTSGFHFRSTSRKVQFQGGPLTYIYFTYFCSYHCTEDSVCLWSLLLGTLKVQLTTLWIFDHEIHISINHGTYRGSFFAFLWPDLPIYRPQNQKSTKFIIKWSEVSSAISYCKSSPKWTALMDQSGRSRESGLYRESERYRERQRNPENGGNCESRRRLAKNRLLEVLFDRHV